MTAAQDVPLRILHIEDSPSDRELVQRDLQRAGLAFEAVDVASQAQLLAALAGSEPDLVLADYRLPGYDGMTALSLVRERFPHVPFIFVSGTLGEERAVAMLKAGATDYILKSNLARLPAAIDRALRDVEELAARRQAEHDRAERVKELLALREVASAVQADLTAEELVQRAAAALSVSFQFPEWSRAVVALEDASALAPRGRDASLACSLHSDVVVDGERRGRVEVGYTEPIAFLEEEQQLLNAVAESLGVWLARHIATRRLRASEARFRALVQRAADMIVLLDRSGHILWASPSASTLFGEPQGGGASRRALDLVHPDDTDRAMDVCAEILASTESVATAELRVRRSDGQWRWVAQTATNLLEDPDVAAIVLNMRDITERHDAAVALRESEQRFRRLSENAQDIVFRLRLQPDVTFEYVNPAVFGLTGYTPDQIYADPALLLEDIIHPDDRRIFAEIAQGSWENGTAELRWQHSDGGWIWIEARHTVIRDNAGNAVAVEGIIRDVTARARSEQALREALAREREATDRMRKFDEMQDTFLTAVSHELRTPLTIVQGLAGLLESKHSELSPDRIELMLSRLHHNADRLGTLLGDLLDIDRLTHGGALTPKLQRVDVDRLIRHVIESIDSRGRSVTTDLQPLSARVDGPKVERIARNLITNAVRHTPADSHIWVKLRPDQVGLRITVEDDGPGVPHSLKTTIFEPFAKGTTDEDKIGGAGIGLNIVAQFAALHGGRAWVEDRPGGGASFHVSLPDPAVDQTDLDPSAPTQEPPTQ